MLGIKDGINSLVKIEVFDEDLIRDTLVADATFPVKNLIGDQ